MDAFKAAEAFSAMGSESRLAVLRVLVQSGTKGLPVGQIQDRTGIPASTLAHHLKFLSGAGILRQEKHGRSIINYAEFGHLEALADFILEECCIDQDHSND